MSTIRTPAFLDPNIAEILSEAARSRPDHPAVLSREEEVTYGELASRAAAVTAALVAARLRPEDRVAIFLERGADAAAAFFGTAAAGGVAIMVNESLRPRQIDHILQHSGATIFLTSEKMLARLARPLATPIAHLDIGRLPAATPGAPLQRIGSDVAFIIYTSGSTGLPKGVVLSHANLWAGWRSVSTYLEITGADRIASLLPFSFDYGFNQLLCAVGTGATLVVERSPLAEQVVTTLRAREVSVLAGVPPLWLQLLASRGFSTPIPSLRAMTNSGGRVPTEAVRRLRELQPTAKLYLMYGLTEAFRATYLPPDQAERRPDSIGQAIPGCEIMILREDGTRCDAGEVGELVQRGPTVALGYWADPEATARVFRPNPVRSVGTPSAERVVFSGDLVRRDEEGYLYFVGRRDGMIKTQGYRVSPDEVANALYSSGEIVECVVGAEPDAARGQRIVAYLVLREGGSLDAVQAYCRAELPLYMVPARFELRESLPRTSSGKHDGRSLSTPTVELSEEPPLEAPPLPG
jgi:amino acid adenylation domain-containing protein